MELETAQKGLFRIKLGDKSDENPRDIMPSSAESDRELLLWCIRRQIGNRAIHGEQPTRTQASLLKGLNDVEATNFVKSEAFVSELLTTLRGLKEQRDKISERIEKEACTSEDLDTLLNALRLIDRAIEQHAKLTTQYESITLARNDPDFELLYDKELTVDDITGGNDA
jgi:hypothetical protein